MKNGFVYLVGAGPGDPGLITVKALQALSAADCIIYDYLANASLLRNYACEKIYVGKQGGDHTLPQNEINDLLVCKAREGRVVVRLKGGDPYIFGRGGEEAEDLAAAGIPFCVVPGVSSFYAAPAYAGIPLTHRDCANAFEVITGHRRGDAADDEDINFPAYDPFRSYVFLMGMKHIARIAAALITDRHFPADTPAAVIAWGTRPEQHTVTGTLATLADEVKKEGMRPPAVIVVGRVVLLRDKLRWFDRLPLFGKSIVVTRTRAQASSLCRKLAAQGARVIELPALEIRESDDMAPLCAAIERIESYGWIVFTSQNAVTIFFRHLFAVGRDARCLGKCRIAVIGRATGDELLKFGLRPDVVPQQFVAESLLEALDNEPLAGTRVLLPCSADARDVLFEGLKSRGASVERIHIYCSEKPAPVAAAVLEDVHNADMITFASSSTVRHFFEMVSETRAVSASIGPVTSATLRELGREPVVEAAEYTIDGLVQAIVAWYRDTAEGGTP
ncbi:MAG: uroporphyrinogen-III C-methyltransferase [Deltaproteobacteria bacterium]|nr:uroporphyrinogen-III C-methyltransferase [Deltaproteobacteria bacterium]